MTIGERIKSLRIKKQLSQESLANKLGITKQAVYKYEANIVTNIPMDKISLLAKILDTSPAYLMGWNENQDVLSTSATPASHSPNDRSLLEDVIIYHRNGKTVTKQFTKEQMDMLLTMIEAIPEKTKDV